MFDHKAYFIETLTNTHVGSGDVTLGVVDKEIQKDPVTSLPVFHPSSIKGAIRDHFESQKDEDNFQPAGSSRMKPFTFYSIFGDLEIEDIEKIQKELDPAADENQESAGERDEADDSSDSASPQTEKKKKGAGKGKQKDEDKEKERMKQELELLKKTPGHGLVKFYEARLLMVPLRSDQRVFYYGTCPAALMDYFRNLLDFNIPGADPNEIGKLNRFLAEEVPSKMGGDDEFCVFGGNDARKPIVEEFENAVVLLENNYRAFTDLLDIYLSPRGQDGIWKALAIFKDDVFREICESGMPVIARNSLDDKGISKNLFYEEILPRRSVLWFMTGTHRHFSEKDKSAYDGGFTFFETQLVSQNIQMGANASVGYGVTQISPVLAGRTKKGGNR
jgi:CRISPR-associated protein Cmr4